MKEIIFLLITTLLFILITRTCIEHFVIEQNAELEYRNKEKGIFNRHKIHNTIPTDKKIKYKNAYYYEYDNKEYEKRLKETFKKEECFVDKLNFKDWKREPSIYINSIYQKIYEYLYEKINNSEYLKLEESEKIQIVHDYLNRYKFSKEEDVFILDLDLILYREFKNHGKHVNLQIAHNPNNNNFNVFFVNIKGIINEDKLHIYPVNHYDPINISHSLV